MATVKVMYWKDIPYAVRAEGDGGRASKQLPKQFEAAVDAAAMAEGLTEMDEYQAAFRWSDEEERPGTAEEAAQAMYDEIVHTYTPVWLARLARREA